MQSLTSHLPNVWLKKRAVLFVILLAIVFIVVYVRHDFFYELWIPTMPKLSALVSSHDIRSDSLPTCSPSPNFSIGAIDVDTVAHSWDSIQAKYIFKMQSSFQLSGDFFNQSRDGTIHRGLGLWSPTSCQSAQTLAIVIPFRDRDEHLRIFVNHMHAFLQHQQLTYTIFIVEQLGDTLFNRAALFNIGFIESRRVADYDCFIFHDVDLLPQDDRIPYRCQDQPVHLSVAVDKFNYRLPYVQLFGGAVALSRWQVERTRGFSNCFFGWGGEDDDMYARLAHHGYKITRHPSALSRYMMLKHDHEKLNQPNPIRTRLLKNSTQRIAHDGYPETRYRMISSGLAYDGLFYRISIDLDKNQTYPEYNQMCQ